MLRKVNLNTCIGKAWGLIDDETGATFWPTNAGACFNATNARFRVAGVDLATLYAAAANDYMLIAKDTAGKAAKGYIDVADDAEALGSELAPTATCTDPLDDQDVTTGWTAEKSTLDSIAGGETGNCLELTKADVPNQRAYNDRAFTEGKLYKITASVKSGTAGDKTYAIGMQERGVDWTGYTTGTTSGDWVAVSAYGVATSGTDSIVLQKTGEDEGTMLFDNVSVKEVTNVGTDGVLIMSTKGGTTQSWTSQDAGIDLNDIATFEVLIAK